MSARESQAQMRQLSDDEIVDVLTGNRIGVLALAGETHPYPLPVGFGYDPDDDLFVLQLEGDAENLKHRCLDRDDAVGFTVYEETEPRTEWRSVVVSGQLTETSYQAAESAFATLAKNAQSVPNPVTWSDASTVTPFELRIDDWSGRAFDIGRP
jgi:nitroimidazol reductase NimA-like FMN-containing flavoprotein (pyridoxamine 5'-phosphate oxidase superfamily)